MSKWESQSIARLSSWRRCVGSRPPRATAAVGTDRPALGSRDVLGRFERKTGRLLARCGRKHAESALSLYFSCWAYHIIARLVPRTELL